MKRISPLIERWFFLAEIVNNCRIGSVRRSVNGFDIGIEFLSHLYYPQSAHFPVLYLIGFYCQILARREGFPLPRRLLSTIPEVNYTTGESIALPGDRQVFDLVAGGTNNGMATNRSDLLVLWLGGSGSDRGTGDGAACSRVYLHESTREHVGLTDPLSEGFTLRSAG